MLAPSNDAFWNIAEREKAEEAALRGQIDHLKARIEVARRVAAMKHATGFNDFVSAIRSMRDAALSDLVGDGRLTDAGIRETRGGIRALDEVLKVLTRDAVQVDLAAQLLDRENLLAEALKRRPKPKPQEATP